MKRPFDSWWAFWRIDQGLDPEEADTRAQAARAARVTKRTGDSWAEQERGTGKSLIFFLR
jgi:hypothetical protein